MNQQLAPQFDEITAVILAGGLGTRLRPVIKDRQKVMAEVGNRPFLEHILEKLNDHGITKAVLCVGYMAEQVQEYFGDKYGDVELRYSEEQLLLGTAGAIRFAMPLIESSTFMVLNGDSFCDADLRDFYESHLTNNCSASMLLVEVEDTRRYGRVDFSNTSQILKFEEKGAVSGPGWINAGIYMLKKSLLEELPKGRNISLEREVFANLVGKDFYAHCGKVKTFIDIGIPEAMEHAQTLFNKGEIQS